MEHSLTQNFSNQQFRMTNLVIIIKSLIIMKSHTEDHRKTHMIGKPCLFITELFIWINSIIKIRKLKILTEFKHNPPGKCIARGRNNILKQFLKIRLVANIINILKQSSETEHRQIIDFYIYLSWDFCSHFKVSSCNPLIPENVLKDILNN